MRENENELANAIDRYTDPTHEEYDPEFTKEMLEIDRKNKKSDPNYESWFLWSPEE